jgi:hypothetical protein
MGDLDDPDWPLNGEPIHYYYHQPVKDVVIYHIMTAWYKILDIPFTSNRLCKNAKAKSLLPRDCAIVHDHTHEPEECWFACPCLVRDLRIHDYRNRNAVQIKDVD